MTQLAWGLVESREGYAKVGELEEALGAVKWGADYLVNCHSGPSRLVAMLGDSREDFAYFGPPEEHAMVRSAKQSDVLQEKSGMHHVHDFFCNTTIVVADFVPK